MTKRQHLYLFHVASVTNVSLRVAPAQDQKISARIHVKADKSVAICETDHVAMALK